MTPLGAEEPELRARLAALRERALELEGTQPPGPAFAQAGDLAARLRALAGRAGYWALEPGLKREWTHWELEVGEPAAAAFARRVLLRLVSEFEPQGHPHHLTPQVQGLCVEFLGAVLENLGREPAGQLSVRADAYLKDLGLAAGLLLPVGARVLEVGSGWSRRVAFTDGPRQLLRFVRLHGLAPDANSHHYQMHVYLRQLGEFTPEGWTRTLRRTAGLLEANPAVKGVFGSAWLYDPALGRISPRLAHVRELALQSGAVPFRIGPDLTGGALARSPTRRRLIEQGRYRPMTYLMVWPRRELIGWARGGAGRRSA